MVEQNPRPDGFRLGLGLLLPRDELALLGIHNCAATSIEDRTRMQGDREMVARRELQGMRFQQDVDAKALDGVVSNDEPAWRFAAHEEHATHQRAVDGFCEKIQESHSKMFRKKFAVVIANSLRKILARVARIIQNKFENIKSKNSKNYLQKVRE